MNRNVIYSFAAACAAALTLAASPANASPSGNLPDPKLRKTYEHAVSLCDKGMYARARAEFESLSLKGDDCMAEGGRVLCAIGMQSEGAEILFDEYESRYPYSSMLPRLRYEYGLLLFDRQNYQEASKMFSYVSAGELTRKLRPEFLYKRAYCDFVTGNTSRAKQRFGEVAALNSAAYSGPARFALGYMAYDEGDFREALRWFEATNDGRFTDVADYYITDCRFMLKDYAYVVETGDRLLPRLKDEKARHIARLLSESYLVLGKADRARELYDSMLAEQPDTSRTGLFFAGSLLYAVNDWQGAVEKYSAMGEKADSLGQISAYNTGYSYIKLRNKVGAMNSFRTASKMEYIPEITEDAMFNYAKLAFDLNSDSAVFEEYMNRYPVEDKSDRIYSYIAVAALRNRDYSAAVDAFDKIDVLDATMKRNYMKSNYLRASQLIADESWNDAVPYLKAAAYYSEKNGRFNQLSRYWLAESYYRNGKYDEALASYADLYNTSALEGMKEGTLVPFNVAYCYFKKGRYEDAVKWFDIYLATGEAAYRKGAMVRRADCQFLLKKYKDAIAGYERVSQTYPNVNDIYPYYQTGVCYGLSGSNDKKINALLPVKKAAKESSYYCEATYELGRAYVSAKRYDDAKSCFLSLTDNPSDSLYYAKAAIELGTMCSNSGDYNAALQWYEHVVSRMPLSSAADDALIAMETVYQRLNKPQAYLDYLASVGRSSLKTEAEKERMIFNSAEQFYLSEDYSRALTTTGDFLARYPHSAMAADAWFYKAECYRNLGHKEDACDAYSKAVELGSASYSEIAMLNFANISYSLQRYDAAYGGYAALRDNARMETNRYTALCGMMRSAWRARRYDDAIAACDAVDADVRSEKDLLRESSFIRAKSFLSTSRRDEAFAIFRELSKLPDTEEGAEASFLLIQDAYDRGDFDSAIQLCFDFSDASDGSRQYWLAKSFIILGDCYAEKGDMVQARATFNSIVEGYENKEDGIIEETMQRIAYLNK